MSQMMHGGRTVRYQQILDQLINIVVVLRVVVKNVVRLQWLVVLVVKVEVNHLIQKNASWPAFATLCVVICVVMSRPKISNVFIFVIILQ